MADASRRILVVDDERDILELVTMKLELMGHDVSTAATGPEALEMCRAGVFDLVVLDVSMPEMTGLEVLRELRTTYGESQLPVLMLSAMASPADIAAGLAAGASGYVTKPFSPTDLGARVLEVLSDP